MTTPRCHHEPLCETPPLPRASFCGEHIGQSHRCTRTRSVEGVSQRCKKYALPGLTVCERHGGRFPQAQEKSKRSKSLTAMQRFVRPRTGDVSLADAFDEEFRRTLGRIDWLNEAIAGLGSSDDPDEETGPSDDYSALIWGKTKEEHIGAGEEPGTNTTYEARVHLLEDMLRWERTHLLQIEKLGIGAGLEQARLDLMKTYASRVASVLETALDALGLDIHDPAVTKALEKARMAGQDAPTSPIIDLKQIGPEEYA